MSELNNILGGGLTLGNENIERQLSFWMRLAKQRAANGSGMPLIVAPTKIFAQLEAGRKELEAQRKEHGRIYPDDVIEEVEGGTTVTLGDLEFEVPVTESLNITITPTKPKRFSTVYDDKLKFELLIQYARDSPDPFVSNELYCRRPHMEKQCQLLMNQEVEYQGQMKRWKDITTVLTMGEKIYRDGFKAQLIGKKKSPSTGLHAILEQVVGVHGTSQMVKDMINDIIEKARKFIS